MARGTRRAHVRLTRRSAIIHVELGGLSAVGARHGQEFGHDRILHAVTVDVGSLRPYARRDKLMLRHHRREYTGATKRGLTNHSRLWLRGFSSATAAQIHLTRGTALSRAAAIAQANPAGTSRSRSA